MVSETIISALVYAVFTSVWQAAFIWILFQLVQRMFPLPAKTIYWILFTLILILFVGWVMNCIYFLHNPSPPTLYFLTETLRLNNVGLSNTFSSIFCILYGLGCLYHGFRFLQSFFQLRLLAKHSLPLPATAMLLIQEMQNQHQSLSKVSIAATDNASSPLTFGWVQPILLFPLAAFNSMSIEEVKSIVLHELAHIRRNDFLHECLISSIEIFMFCNPFLRLLINELREEREKACDDEVIQSGIPVYSYAKALMVLAQNDIAHQPIPAMAFTGNQPRLLNRLKRLVSTKPEKKSIPLFNTCLSVLILFAGCIWMNSYTNNGKFIINPATVSTNVMAGSKITVGLQQQKHATTAVVTASQPGIRSAINGKSSLPAPSSKRLNRLANPATTVHLQETADNIATLPVVAVSNESIAGLAKLEQLQKNWMALPDSLTNVFTSNAIAAFSPEDRIIWMQALQKIYEVVNPENESYITTLGRQAPFIILLHAPVSSTLSNLALQHVASIRKQMEAYYLSNYIMIQNANTKDSTRLNSLEAPIQ